MPVFIMLLALAPAVSAAGLLMPFPISYMAGGAGLLCGFSGLYFLYQDILRPIKNISLCLQQPGTLHLPHDADCGILRDMADIMTGRCEEVSNTLAANLRDLEKFQHEATEWHEKYKIAMTGQVMIKDSLHEIVNKMHKLSSDQTEQSRKLLEAHPELAQEPFFNGFSVQWLDRIIAELEYCENYVEQMTAFLGDPETDPVDDQVELQEDYVQWSDDFSTGVPVIDGQHKLLLSYINKLHRGIMKKEASDLLLEILDALAGYAFTHFNTEEIFFAHSNYPGAKTHIEVHQQFRDKVLLFRESVLEGKSGVDMALLEFLKTWLIEHIQGMDVSFAPYVAPKQDADRASPESLATGAPVAGRPEPVRVAADRNSVNT